MGWKFFHLSFVQQGNGDYTDETLEFTLGKKTKGES